MDKLPARACKTEKKICGDKLSDTENNGGTLLWIP